MVKVITHTCINVNRNVNKYCQNCIIIYDNNYYLSLKLNNTT